MAGLSDGQLLERFALRDGEVAEVAFAALVERHGRLVWRTCRTMLRDEQDAQDAFQASFLVLATKARGLRVDETLAPWLYQVAVRVAASSRTATARRRRHERTAAAARSLIDEGPAPTDDLGSLLHEEIERLPARFRAPVVLCCLEGLTREQAAGRLGWPVGTLQSRLARARDRLRERLTRRGLGVPAGLVAARSSSVPSRLSAEATLAALEFARTGPTSAGTVSAAVNALTQGVLWTMFWTKTKTATFAVALTALLAVGAASMGRSPTAQAGDEKSSPTAGQKGPAVLKFEVQSWKDGERSGKPTTIEVVSGSTGTINTEDYTITFQPRRGHDRALLGRELGVDNSLELVSRLDAGADLEQVSLDLAKLIRLDEVRSDLARVSDDVVKQDAEAHARALAQDQTRDHEALAKALAQDRARAHEDLVRQQHLSRKEGDLAHLEKALELLRSRNAIDQDVREDLTKLLHDYLMKNKAAQDEAHKALLHGLLQDRTKKAADQDARPKGDSTARSDYYPSQTKKAAGDARPKGDEPSKTLLAPRSRDVQQAKGASQDNAPFEELAKAAKDQDARLTSLERKLDEVVRLLTDRAKDQNRKAPDTDRAPERR
jgi:RNA polymerase sigma factor (sigma-70 family)